MSTAQLSAVFFLQLFFILAVCRLVGLLARRLGQPQVVGEMIAGVIMGPSLFGLLLPSWQQAIFPKESLKILYVLAQVGVGLYMFLVGTEFKTELFRSKVRSAASVSVAGMLAPLILGGALALWLWKIPGLFSEKATEFEAILFLGAAMSITAFPMWQEAPWSPATSARLCAAASAARNSFGGGSVQLIWRIAKWSWPRIPRQGSCSFPTTIWCWPSARFRII